MSMARMTAHAFLTTRETADIATMVRGRSEHIRTHDGKTNTLETVCLDICFISSRRKGDTSIRQRIDTVPLSLLLD